MTIHLDPLQKTTRINALFDFYSTLLTHKQQTIVQLYFQDNYSLSEIADEMDISRQAVNDSLRRTEESLEQYEEKLQLYRKHQQRCEQVASLSQLVNEAKFTQQLQQLLMIDYS